MTREEINRRIVKARKHIDAGFMMFADKEHFDALFYLTTYLLSECERLEKLWTNQITFGREQLEHANQIIKELSDLWSRR